MCSRTHISQLLDFMLLRKGEPPDGGEGGFLAIFYKQRTYWPPCLPWIIRIQEKRGLGKKGPRKKGPKNMGA